MLRPNYALAQQVPKDDKRIKAEYTMYPFTQRQLIKRHDARIARPTSDRRQISRRRGGSRKPRAQPIYRRCGAALGCRRLHGIWLRMRFGRLAVIRAWTSMAPKPMKRRKRCREVSTKRNSSKTASPRASFCSSIHSQPASLAPWVFALAAEWSTARGPDAATCRGSAFLRRGARDCRRAEDQSSGAAQFC